MGRVGKRLKAAQDELAQSVAQFYERKLVRRKKETVFGWSVYKKSSQLRYSLAIEILTGISRGVYPEGSYLPPAEKLSREKGVSVSTIRRTVSLLNSIRSGEIIQDPWRACFPRCRAPGTATLHPDIQVRLLEGGGKPADIHAVLRAVSKITLDSVDKVRSCSGNNACPVSRTAGVMR